MTSFDDIFGDILGDALAKQREAARIAREAAYARPFEDSELSEAIAAVRRLAGIPSSQHVDPKRALGELQVLMGSGKFPVLTNDEDLLLTRFFRHQHGVKS